MKTSGGVKMKCIYFTGTICKAKPNISSSLDYTPTEEEKENYCNNLKFSTCPRYDAILDYIKAVKRNV